ncbi:hypothetical protein HPP92_022576 [Vanilla planifolia]|uniref:Uncharacterized protein n=1 Tax=Vanilla planifolia TaxID=51239 RepID=A0A835UC19_VANPL|nr:hypothetical protein HPP92_022576 [Vanilla planifolia]
MISVLAQERLLGAVLGSAFVGVIVFEQRKGIHGSISDDKSIQIAKYEDGFPNSLALAYGDKCRTTEIRNDRFGTVGWKWYHSCGSKRSLKANCDRVGRARDKSTHRVLTTWRQFLGQINTFSVILFLFLGRKNRSFLVAISSSFVTGGTSPLSRSLQEEDDQEKNKAFGAFVFSILTLSFSHHSPGVALY